jgi:hypothetical protein
MAIPVWPDEYLLAVEFFRAESLSAPKHHRFPFAMPVFALRTGADNAGIAGRENRGEGVSSDVPTWAPGQVVKLFKAGTPRRVSWCEARITRAVFAAGVPAPEVFGEITLDGRHGIVLGRLEGPPLLQHYRSGAVTFEQAGVILADLAMSVHRTPPPPECQSAFKFDPRIASSASVTLMAPL